MRKLHLLIFSLLSLLWGTALTRASEIPLRYDSKLAAKGFASPLIELTINGKKGLFLIDSGASIHVISDWFAAKAKISAQPSGIVGGAAGGSEKSSFAQIGFAVKTRSDEVLSVDHQWAAITRLPDEFQRNGLAGVISPQLFLKDRHQACFIELSKPTLKIASTSNPSELRDGQSLRVIHLAGPHDSKTTLYSLDATVDSSKASFIIDTGADVTSLNIESSSAIALLPKSVATSEKVGGVDGSRKEVRLVPRASLEMGAKTYEVKIRLQPTSKAMPADGMLGMPVLKNCSIVLAQDFGSIFCR